MDRSHALSRLRTGLQKVAGRDLFNVAVTSVPSRRVRRIWLKRILGNLGSSSSVCLRVRLLEPQGIAIGDRTVIGPDCYLDGRSGLTIESDVDIAPGCHIWTLEHDPNSPSHGVKGKPVVIRDHVWIASRATILPGVTIGRGAVVGSGSVVTSDVGDNEIVAGIPAKTIGRRDNALEYRLSFGGRFR